MPTYEWVCLRCGARFEMLRPVADRDMPADCPMCESTETKRALAKPGLLFTGGGWGGGKAGYGRA